MKQRRNRVSTEMLPSLHGDGSAPTDSLLNCLDDCAGDGAAEPADESVDLPKTPHHLLIAKEAAPQDEELVLTLDKDFGELAIVRDIPHRGILRLADIRAADPGLAAVAAINAHGAALTKGAVVTVEPGRVRVRPPESGDD